MILPAPLVSIVVPTYNRANLIAETIQSVLDQTFQQWELIIADDGSFDNTRSVVASFGDPRIHYHYFEHTGIIDTLRNFGIKSAEGEFIAFLDSDDLWFPTKIARQVELLRKYPQAMFAFTNGVEFGEKGIIYHPPDVFHLRNQADDDVFVGNTFDGLIGNDYMTYTPSLMFKKEAISRIGLMDETLKSCFGFEYFLRLACNFTGIAVNEQLVKVRKHHGSASVLREIISYDTSSEIIRRYYQNGHISNGRYISLLSGFRYKAGLVHLRNHDGRKARNYFKEYLFIKPYGIAGWVRLLQSVFGNYTYRLK